MKNTKTKTTGAKSKGIDVKKAKTVKEKKTVKKL
jgi:hypothetical protein